MESLRVCEPFGTGIYLSASYFDHNCQPNARAIFTGRQLQIVATKDIHTSTKLGSIENDETQTNDISSHVMIYHNLL